MDQRTGPVDGVPATENKQKQEAPKIARLRKRFPTIELLRRRARRRVPRFAFDFVDGAANDEVCRRRNAEALAAVEILPRYCVETKGVSTEVELFGRRYAAPSSPESAPTNVLNIKLKSRGAVSVPNVLESGPSTLSY